MRSWIAAVAAITAISCSPGADVGLLGVSLERSASCIDCGQSHVAGRLAMFPADPDLVIEPGAIQFARYWADEFAEEGEPGWFLTVILTQAAAQELEELVRERVDSEPRVAAFSVAGEFSTAVESSEIGQAMALPFESEAELVAFTTALGIQPTRRTETFTRDPAVEEALAKSRKLRATPSDEQEPSN